MALYISFDGDMPGGTTLQTDDFELSDGRDLILNRDSDGHVHGLEIT